MKRYWLLAPLGMALLASDGRAEVRGTQAPESLEIRGSGAVQPLATRSGVSQTGRFCFSTTSVFWARS